MNEALSLTDQRAYMRNQFTITRLKEKIYSAEGIRPTVQRLVYAGKGMSGTRTVADYGLSPARPIYLVRQELCCGRGHSMRQERHDAGECDACSVVGTTHRCSWGCDFDLCALCHASKSHALASRQSAE